MATYASSHAAPCAGVPAAPRIDAGPPPIRDAENPPVAPIIERPPPPEGRGLAVPLFHVALAAAHCGIDERARVVGLIYALWALRDMIARR